MGFLDNLSRGIGQGIERAKFEAEKFQRVSRIQGELNELKKQIEARRLEFGDRAMDLYRAGKIQSPTLGEILRAIESLHTSVTLKEEELKTAQSQNFEGQPPSPPAQSVPVSAETPRAGTPAQPADSAQKKSCPNCQFQMPATSMFCPNCGARMGA